MGYSLCLCPIKRMPGLYWLNTAAFTYYYDPVILTRLSIFRYLALRKRDSKKFVLLLCVI